MTNPTPHGQVPEALLLADQYAAAHAKWALEDLYGSSKSYTAEKLAERHAVRAKLERALHAQVAALTAAPVLRTNTKTHDLLSTMIGLFLRAKEKIGYQPGSAIDKTVAEAVEHLKDWPYPETASPAQPAAPQGVAYAELPEPFDVCALRSARDHNGAHPLAPGGTANKKEVK